MVRLFLIFGISLTIASALISNNFVQKNVHKAQSYKEDQSEIDSKISNLWQKQSVLEQNLDTAVILKAVAADENLINDFIRKTNIKIGTSVEAQPTYASLGTNFERYKQEIIKNINDLYLEKIQIQEKIAKLNSNISLYFNLAILAQMLGLILILSKDFIYMN